MCACRADFGPKAVFLLLTTIEGILAEIKNVKVRPMKTKRKDKTGRDAGGQ
jgi:C4-type Zn-finger protein